MQSILNLAYVVYRFDVGGLERCVARLCEHLDRERFRPIVVCLERSGAAAGWITREDVEIVELHKKPRNDLGVIRRLARVLKEKRIDVVHSHNWGTLIETTLARRRAGVPVHVHTEHGQGLHEGLRGAKQWLRGRARRWAFQRASAVAVCAESVRPLIHQQCGFPQERMLFLANGVEKPAAGTDNAATLRGQLRLNADAMVIGSVGRLVAVKDFALAIEAIAQLVSKGRDVHLVLVGDGPEEANLREQASRLQLSDHVHLIGRQEDVGDWLALMDVYVNSSRSEAMSMGVLEAMAAGLPMVVTDAGDNAALVDGETPCGRVVPPQDAVSLATAIAELLDDGGRRETMSEYARRCYQARYSITRMTEQHAALYERLLSERTAQPRYQRPVEPAATH